MRNWRIRIGLFCHFTSVRKLLFVIKRRAFQSKIEFYYLQFFGENGIFYAESSLFEDSYDLPYSSIFIDFTGLVDLYFFNKDVG